MCGSAIYPSVLPRKTPTEVARVFSPGLFVSHAGSLKEALAKQVSDHHQESEKHQSSYTKDQYTD